MDASGSQTSVDSSKRTEARGEHDRTLGAHVERKMRRRSRSAANREAEADAAAMVAHVLPILSEEERALVDGLRDLRAAESEGPRPTPPGLLGHGVVSKRRAATLLEVTRSEIDLLAKLQSRIGHTLPVLDGGKVPLSELRRQWERREKRRLQDLARSVVNMVRVKGIEGWRPSRSILVDADGGDRDGFHGVFFADDVAARLKVTKAEAQQLMSDTGPLFTWVVGPRQRRFATREELEAYELAGQRSANAHARRVAEEVWAGFDGPWGPRPERKTARPTKRKAVAA